METATSVPASRGASAGRNGSKRKREAPVIKDSPSKKTHNSRHARDGAEETSVGLTLDTTEDQSPPRTTTQENGTAGSRPSFEDAARVAMAAYKGSYNMKVPQHPDATFLNEPAHDDSHSDVESTDLSTLKPLVAQPPVDANAGSESSPEPPTPPPNLYASHSGRYQPKLQVGSKMYEAQRKANHKEVERRRRETINEGINELAKLVPGEVNSKGHVLLKASMYIQKLQEEANTNIDKWTFEKLITEQAISEMSAKLGQAWQEKNVWKEKAKEAGVDVVAVEAEMRKGINRVLSDESDPRKESSKKTEAPSKADRDGERTGMTKAASAAEEESESESEGGGEE